MILKILTSALPLIFFATFAHAQCDVCKVANQKESAHYVDYTGAKLLQGTTNMAFSWMELGLGPTKAYAQAKKGACPVQTGLGGLADGFGSACYRIAEGSGEILTAFWPQRVLAPANCEVCNVEEMKSKGIVS